MDPGLAAVLGATVGVLGSLGTAVLTWSATRWRVRTETRTEHARWRHQVRRDAYIGLLTSARTATSALLTALETLHANREQEAQQELTRAWQLLGPLESTLATVRLEGPMAVVPAAADLAEAVFTLFNATAPCRQGKRLDDPQVWAAYKTARSKPNDATARFTEVAQRELNREP